MARGEPALGVGRPPGRQGRPDRAHARGGGAHRSYALTFVRQWDSFFWPLVATSSPEYTVVQVGLAKYITEFVTFWDRLLAGAVSASVPALVRYFLLQRYYVQGISTTGLKT